MVLPTPVVAGVAFVGPNLDKFFVATSSYTVVPSTGLYVYETATAPFAGKLYKVTGLATTGTAGPVFRL